MRTAGLLVIPAGFFLSISALVLFPATQLAVRATFVVCGLGVEALGIVVAMRRPSRTEGNSRS
jgi:hypothetical protein